MRIIRRSIYQIDIPLSRIITTGDGASTSLADTTVVKLTSDGGLEGWGAVTPLWEGVDPGLAEAVRDQIRAADLVGLTVGRVEDIVELFDDHRQLTPGWSAVDCALWDLTAKHAGLPTAQLIATDAATIVSVGSNAVPTSVAHCGGITGLLRLPPEHRPHIGEAVGTEVELAAVAHVAAATGASMHDHTADNLMALGGDGVIVEGSIASVRTSPGTLTEPNLGILGLPIEEAD